MVEKNDAWKVWEVEGLEDKLVTYTGGKRPSSSDQLAAEPMRTEGTTLATLMTDKREKDTGRR